MFRPPAVWHERNKIGENERESATESIPGRVRFPRATRLFIRIPGNVHYLWRAVEQDGDVIDILVQYRCDAKAAKRFFNKVLKGQGAEPIRLTTDGLKSYPPAAREILPGAHHDTSQYANTYEAPGCQGQNVPAE